MFTPSRELQAIKCALKVCMDQVTHRGQACRHPPLQFQPSLFVFRLDVATMKVFVTGGTGFIGSRVVDLLLAAEHTVTCLVRVRDPSKAAYLRSKGVQLAVGSLGSLSLLADQARNADATVCCSVTKLSEA